MDALKESMKCLFNNMDYLKKQFKEQKELVKKLSERLEKLKKLEEELLIGQMILLIEKVLLKTF